MAANASPEPFSNWALSLLEDVFVVTLGLRDAQVPALALAVSVLVLVTLAWHARWIWRWLRRSAQGAPA